VRIGIGHVLRGFEPTRPLVLGGVKLMDGWGLRGKDDGDVLLLALCDAVLGAAGLGGRGDHMGEDPLPSAVLLSEVRVKAQARGFHIENVDACIYAERLDVLPHRALMEERVAELLGIDPKAVNVKTDQAGGLGPVGEAKAVAAQAVVLLREDVA